MKNLLILGLVAIAALVSPQLSGSMAFAQAEPARGPIAQRLSVEGNQRIEEATILSYMVVRVGQPYNPAMIDLSLKTLHNTGLFSDVQILPEGGVIIVKVVENPIINRIAFEGNNKLTDKNLDEEVQLKPRKVFTRAAVQKDVTRVLELYRRSGRFAATVEPKIVQLPQNRVDLVFEINEGPSTGVDRIIFIGNKNFSDATLRSKIATAESSWWNFLQSNDNYDPDRLTFDREQLRRFYLANGYADFRVVSAVAELAPDRSGFYITFTVDEGDLYAFGKVDIESSIKDIDKDRLMSLIKIEPGETYNAELIDKSIDALTILAGEKGYAFVDIRPRVKRNREDRVVDVVFKIEEGPRVYVDRINIVGNTRTLDKVIRREIRLSEGDAFNRVLLNRSRSRIRGLGFFKKVEITEEPGGAPDRTNLNVEVEEQSTGELSVSAGFSSADSIVGSFSLTEKNLLGKGQFLRLQLQVSGERQQIDLRFTEPYFLDRNLSAGVDVYSTRTQVDESFYEADLIGGGLRLGFPTSEFGRLGLRYSLRQENYDYDLDGLLANVNASRTAQGQPTLSFSNPADAATIDAVLGSYIRADGQQVLFSVLGYTFIYDERDDPIEPRAGYRFSVSQDLAGLGGDKHYLKTEVNGDWYQRIWGDDFVLTTSLAAGHIMAWGDDILEPTDRFLKGGGSFRGFKTSGVGPREINSRSYQGGELFAIGTLELSVPNFLPEDLGIKTSIFADVGTIGLIDDLPVGNCTGVNTACVQDDLSLRASVGVSVSWNSPFGPVRLDFSHVLANEDYDETETFRFSAGTKL
ncbi:MAG TPA: outer membrane protein assembly factor BamA [Alphaproteobacteria bacterium]|nr:outer membrane protein assembly factor BamA [Alphaproteobacteria bacterium]HAJ46595.1 outer membrane protein assembly factor BamA [Alphaproteobacteria bacterium]